MKPTLSGTPPAGAINEPYAFTFTHTGVPSPIIAKSAGTLPPGLTLNSSGYLSGTPTKAGTYHFTVQATNIAGSASKAVTLVVYPAPVIVAYGANVKESNAGTQPLAFRLTLNRASKLSVTVHYATANGSAKAGTDFVGASGTLTFSPGQTSKTVTVGVKGDRVREPNEVFYLLLYSPVHAGIKTSSAVGGILNDD